jgi:hypothetical protein
VIIQTGALAGRAIEDDILLSVLERESRARLGCVRVRYCINRAQG